MPKEVKDDFEAVRQLVDALSPFENTDRERIIRWACEKLGLPVNQPISSITTLPPRPAIITDSSPDVSVKKANLDIKSFVDEKDPKNDSQLAAVVAYYYAFEAPELERKLSIGSSDLVDACRLAQRRRPGKPVQTLINAAHSGLLDKAEESGKYKLNAVGENLVAMTLPGESEGRRSPKKKALSDSRKKGKKPKPTVKKKK